MSARLYCHGDDCLSVYEGRSVRGDAKLALSVSEAEKQWVGRWDASDFPLPAVLVILFEGNVSVTCCNQNTCHHHCVGLCLRENYGLLLHTLAFLLLSTLVMNFWLQKLFCCLVCTVCGSDLLTVWLSNNAGDPWLKRWTGATDLIYQHLQTAEIMLKREITVRILRLQFTIMKCWVLLLPWRKSYCIILTLVDATKCCAIRLQTVVTVCLL